MIQSESQLDWNLLVIFCLYHKERKFESTRKRKIKDG